MEKDLVFLKGNENSEEYKVLVKREKDLYVLAEKNTFDNRIEKRIFLSSEDIKKIIAFYNN